MTTTATVRTRRTSSPPRLITVRCGNSTSHRGSESAVIVREFAWSISQVR